MSEVKHLRKLDFPDSVLEAFRIVEKLCLDHTTASYDLASKISEEFIFQEQDRKGNRRRMSPMRELEILERMTTYFVEQKNETMFLWLFVPGKRIAENRLSILNKLISMAVADSNSHILNLSGIWIQLSDCQSEPALHVTKSVINDYFMLMPTFPPSLLKLPRISPLFCASFITSVTCLYKLPSSMPPVKLLERVLEWLTMNPSIAFAPLLMATSQKNGTPQTPISGLLNWCILIPLVDSENVMFSQLHLTTLEILSSVGNADPMLQKLKHNVISLYKILKIVDELKHHNNNPNIQMCLDRLAQVLQILLGNGCLKSLNEIFLIINLLPYNRLMEIVLNKWK